MTDRIAKEYPELDEAVTLTIYTKAPQKWLLIDRETGQVYEGSASGKWDKLRNTSPQPSPRPLMNVVDDSLQKSLG